MQDNLRGTSDVQAESPGRPGFVVWFVAACLGVFVALQVLAPQAMLHTLETDGGPWMGGLTIGMVLGIGMLLVPLVLGLTQALRQ